MLRHRQHYSEAYSKSSSIPQHAVSSRSQASLRSSQGTGGLSNSNFNTRLSEHSGRRSLSKLSNSNGMGAPNRRILKAKRDPRTVRDRPLCNPSQHQTSQIHLPVSPPASDRRRCFFPQLERVEPNLLVSPSKSSRSSSEPNPPRETSRPLNSAEKAIGPLVLHDVCPQSNPTHNSATFSDRSRQNHHMQRLQLLRRMDRIFFLKEMYTQKYSANLAESLIKAYRTSSTRQFEVGWKTFKEWLPETVSEINELVVLNFLEYLFITKQLNPRTILAYRNSLSLPLKLAFDLDLQSETFSSLSKSQFLRRPPAPRIVPSWSLEAALTASNNLVNGELSEENLLLKTLFLTALATGNRASELSNLNRQTILFTTNFSQVSIAVRKGFLYKNQTMSRTPNNIVFPSLSEQISNCPVRALDLYLKKTYSYSLHRYFFNPKTHKPLNNSTLAYWLCKAIKMLVPGAMPRSHDVRKQAFSLSWARGTPLPTIVRQGFWQNQTPFINKYLNTVDSFRPCVAAGFSL